MLPARSARPALSPIAIAVLTAFALPAQAAGEPLAVDSRLLLATQLGSAAAAPSGKPPTMLEADVLEGRTDTELRARGNVRVERGNTVLKADTLRIDQITDDAQADGNVELRRSGDVIRGPSLKLNLDTFEGSFTTPEYTVHAPSRRGLTGAAGSGNADELRFEGENQYRLFNATYSTCPAPSPDWYLRASDIDLDFDRDKGTARHATLWFQNVPMLYMPWAEFPLSGGRQSGFLPPTIGSSTNTGVDLALPYYFNLAPNYDATLTPRWMGRRGLQLGNEFRYLTRTMTGRFNGEYLARDEVTSESRWFGSLYHSHSFGAGWSAGIDAAQVSDRDYFADLSTRVAATSQSALNQQATLSYSNGAWLTAGANMQRYQVITGSTPYSRLPQITARVTQPDVAGFVFQMPSEYTRFHHPTLDEGQRSWMYPQMSYPLVGTAAFLLPKVGMHLAHYDLERRVTTGPSSVKRYVPIASLDTGLIFERDTRWGDTDYTQTLEPRLYYLRAGNRKQSDIPVFDTARADYNFAQLYSENIYTGSDRIADANQLTLGLSSRFIESATGVEWMRLGLGQRFYFSDQLVTLPGETPREGKIADWLGGASGRVYEDVWLDTLMQYDPREDRSERATLSLRYQPGHARTLAASWRFKRGEFRDLDLSVQWPVLRNWYAVGRYNRDLRNDRTTEAIAGFEYKGDCWVLRFAFQKLINTKQEYNNSVFLQLEFNGLASLGPSPVQLLRRGVSGYGNINDPGATDPLFGGP